mgnify:CR=1 FL=1
MKLAMAKFCQGRSACSMPRAGLCIELTPVLTLSSPDLPVRF